MYQFPQEINQVNFYRQSKPFVLRGHWAEMPKASKAIYPVIACHADEKGISYPGTETIAALAGIDSDTVTKGIKGLKDNTLLVRKIETYVTCKGHSAYRYHLDFPAMEKGLSFPFYKSLLEGGNWAMLNSSGKALYMAIRAYAFYDEYNLGFVMEDYVERTNEVCEADVKILCEFAGIHPKSFKSGLQSLIDCYLAEITQKNQIKIFIRPEKRFMSEFMDELSKGKKRKKFGTKYLLSMF